MNRHERRILKIVEHKKVLQESLYELNWYDAINMYAFTQHTCFVIKEAQRAYDKDVLEQQISSSITDPEVKKSLAKVQQKAFKNFSDSATVSSKPQVTTEPGKQGKKNNKGAADLAAKAKAAFQESYNQRQMKPPAENKLLWWQLVTPEGHPYYYNTVTGGECYNVQYDFMFVWLAWDSGSVNFMICH